MPIPNASNPGLRDLGEIKLFLKSQQFSLLPRYMHDLDDFVHNTWIGKLC